MIRASLFALTFAVVGLVAFALLAPFLVPLFFHGVDYRKVGADAFGVIVLVCGASGFVFGLRRSKK
jgi:high-affinity K+ transport system ATPase subunit B